mmetsp:Transcript_14670/g.40319  ORF Transcript_14670/g.40319 Transcript_14670/m.40319 type:complete len:289 (+) Transcript_14670:636-1502(+)
MGDFSEYCKSCTLSLPYWSLYIIATYSGCATSVVSPVCNSSPSVVSLREVMPERAWFNTAALARFSLMSAPAELDKLDSNTQWYRDQVFHRTYIPSAWQESVAPRGCVSFIVTSSSQSPRSSEKRRNRGPVAHPRKVSHVALVFNQSAQRSPAQLATWGLHWKSRHLTFTCITSPMGWAASVKRRMKTPQPSPSSCQQDQMRAKPPGSGWARTSALENSLELLLASVGTPRFSPLTTTNQTCPPLVQEMTVSPTRRLTASPNPSRLGRCHMSVLFTTRGSWPLPQSRS